MEMEPRTQCLHQKFIGLGESPRRCLLFMGHGGACDFEAKFRTLLDLRRDTSTPSSLAKLKRTVPGDAAAMLSTFTDEEMLSEFDRRHPEMVDGLHPKLLPLLRDEQLRAECERRRLGTEFIHNDCHAETAAVARERDEWKSRAEAAEKFRDSQQEALDAGRSAARNLAEVTRVCGLYGLPVGVNVLTWLEASLRIAAGARERVNKRESIEAEHTPDSGRGLAQLHFERPRPDNSVAHLDEDLLCEDAP